MWISEAHLITQVLTLKMPHSLDLHAMVTEYCFLGSSSLKVKIMSMAQSTNTYTLQNLMPNLQCHPTFWTHTPACTASLQCYHFCQPTTCLILTWPAVMSWNSGNFQSRPLCPVPGIISDMVCKVLLLTQLPFLIECFYKQGFFKSNFITAVLPWILLLTSYLIIILQRRFFQRYLPIWSHNHWQL